MNILNALFSKQSDKRLKDRAAELLRMSPEALAEFERIYRETALDTPDPSGGLFDVAASQVKAMSQNAAPDTCPKEIIARAVDELAAGTEIIHVTRDGKTEREDIPALPDGTDMLSKTDLEHIHPAARPQATGSLMKLDLSGEMSCLAVLSNYKDYLENPSRKKRMDSYNRFRQGLDILDLDPVLYAMLGANPNSMSHWLPGIAAAAGKHEFFKIPETRIAKVPMPLLQLSRIDYGTLSPATKSILDQWAYRVFKLDDAGNYFVKTGIFSSKFDFRNAHVTGPQEVRELGEYLLFIHNQAVLMAGPLASPSIYGAGTTNEWAVREYIPDTGNNPCIYKGLPLRTEYRVFVDFDTQEVLGIAPYWDPDVMKSRFANQDDASSIHNRHDYVIYTMHEPILMKRFETNKNLVRDRIAELLPDTGLSGQWSIDVMQDGNDFWIIDMATADTSALSSCVPAGRLKPARIEWLRLPDAGEKER